MISRVLIGNIAQILEFNLAVGYLFGGQETSVIQNGNETRGDDIRITQASLRPDVRFYLGPLANIPNIGNVGNLGFGLTNCYAGIQGAIGLSGADSGLNTDQHGADNQPDTKLSVKYSGGLTPLCGMPNFSTAK
ncbi:MAG: hypothetical protein D6690_16645 [Nitrospirae bacterium]|nr:MAG: hypothetical protein D6690_16645 [Nitrospirota bacterium]